MYGRTDGCAVTPNMEPDNHILANLHPYIPRKGTIASALYKLIPLLHTVDYGATTDCCFFLHY